MLLTSNEPATNEHHSSVQFKTVRELLMNIDLEHLAQLFEAENIDIDVVAEMTHEYLKSVGISTINAFALKKTQNVVETIIDAPPVFEFSCKNCGKTFISLDNLNDHIKADHSQPSQSVYNSEVPTNLEYSCYNCDDTFTSLNILNKHNGTKISNNIADMKEETSLMTSRYT